jgi:UDP-N-acetyl-D-glucosamine/UDP-N-acetyl-D-galactosamine dehydrogenase
MDNITIGIIGLGYVGLPLAVEFGKKYQVIGFDIKQKRIEELRSGIDRTKEVDEKSLEKARFLTFSTEKEKLKSCNYFIITVPTPLDKYKNPDLGPLIGASTIIGSVLKKGDIVIYESTVYPGCTEEECVPVLEKISGLVFNHDFFCGYSPERINPGDKSHRLPDIFKVTSGSTSEIASKVDALYKSIITAGTYIAPSIKIAEAAKVIENSQRDINIAFVNELSLIFHRMGIDTLEVLKAAGTKWNFLNFKPGLVGGHCIGVDPYYLTFKAQSLGYHPEVILSGRRINDGMGITVANNVIKLMIKKGHKIENADILILGMTFKENVPDIRNSRVIDIINELTDFGCHIDVYDPIADSEEVKEEYGITLIETINKKYDSIVIAVAHTEFEGFDFLSFMKEKGVLFDVKGILPAKRADGRL